MMQIKVMKKNDGKVPKLVIGLREINKRMSTKKSEVSRESTIRQWMSIERFLQFMNARLPAPHRIHI